MKFVTVHSLLFHLFWKVFHNLQGHAFQDESGTTNPSTRTWLLQRLAQLLLFCLPTLWIYDSGSFGALCFFSLTIIKQNRKCRGWTLTTVNPDNLTPVIQIWHVLNQHAVQTSNRAIILPLVSSDLLLSKQSLENGTTNDRGRPLSSGFSFESITLMFLMVGLGYSS